MKDTTEPTELEIVQELFDLLQGHPPERYTIPEGHMPNLTADQAWTVVWHLGNLYRQIPDHIERCDVCGELYDTEREGETNDHLPGPIFACGACVEAGETFAQRRIGRKLEKQQEAAYRARKAAQP